MYYHNLETKFCFSDHCATLTPGPLCGTARCLQSKFCGQVRKNSINLTRKNSYHLEILFLFAEKYKQKHTLLVQKWAWTNQKDPWISPPPPTRDPLLQWKMEKRSLKKSSLMRRSSLMTPQRYGIYYFSHVFCFYWNCLFGSRSRFVQTCLNQFKSGQKMAIFGYTWCWK